MTMVLLCYARCYITGQSEKVRVGARGLLVGVCLLVLSSMQGGVQAMTTPAMAMGPTTTIEDQILSEILGDAFSVTINPDSVPGLMQEALDLDAQSQIRLFSARDIQFITLVKEYFETTDQAQHLIGLSTLVDRMDRIDQSYWDRIGVQGGIIASVFSFIEQELGESFVSGTEFTTPNYSVVYNDGYATFKQTSFKTVSMMNVYKNGQPMYVCDFGKCNEFTLKAERGDEFTLYMSSIHFGQEGRKNTVDL